VLLLFLQVLPPIPTTGLTAADVDDLTRRTRELMLQELVKLTEEERGREALGCESAESTWTISGANHGTRHVDGQVKAAL